MENESQGDNRLSDLRPRVFAIPNSSVDDEIIYFSIFTTYTIYRTISVLETKAMPT